MYIINLAFKKLIYFKDYLFEKFYIIIITVILKVEAHHVSALL